LNNETNAPVTAPPGPAGLAGWLILVGLGLIVAPIRIAMYLNETFPPVFRDGIWDLVTTPGPPPYHPLWGTILIGELGINLLFILGAVGLLMLFFVKSARFPKWFIVFMVVNVLFVVLDALATQLVLPDQPVFDAQAKVDLLKQLVASAIWIPYMLLSRRVKNTFVM
jgi:hypothetical protein